MSANFIELDGSDTVFRFFSPGDAFVPAGQSTLNGAIFIPSPQDREEAKKKGTNVQLTVWDLNATTYQQAKAMWGNCAPSIVYGIGVIDVLKVREHCKDTKLRIIRVPLPRELGPGHDGHCGFEGLDRPPGQKRIAFKTLRDVLAQHCFELARI